MTEGRTERTEFGRKVERGSHEREAFNAVVDAARIGHLAFVIDSQPYAVPMAFGREGDALYFHGSTGGRAMRVLAEGAPCCFTVTHLDGLVLARSAFNSSMNYRSAMAFGVCEIVDGDAKWRALDVITDHLLPERRGSLRPMTKKEVAATLVLRLPITEFSVKSRSGGPGDEPEDVHWPVWAGVLPIETRFAEPVPADDLDDRFAVPALLLLWQA